MLARIFAACILVLSPALPCFACSLCSPDARSGRPYRVQIADAKAVVYGTLSNPQLNPDGSGTTELRVTTVLKSHASIAGLKSIKLPKYLPVEPGVPAYWIVFGDVINDRLDFLTGRPVPDAALISYVQDLQKLPAKDALKAIAFFVRHLDHPCAEVTADAFLELALANDADIAASRQIDAGRIRKLILDDNTPSQRLGLLAYLLGACGDEADTKLLQKLLADTSNRARSAIGGVLAGLIMLRPVEGWASASSLVTDTRRSFLDRYAVISTYRFYQAVQPDKAKPHVLAALGKVIEQPDLADVAVEDLRRWQWWDHTRAILAKADHRDYQIPIVRRAILRYALTCPGDEAKATIKAATTRDPELIAELRESLMYTTSEKP